MIEEFSETINEILQLIFFHFSC